jgi:hypothetical protein
MPDHSTTLVEARPAPTSPPISACVEELGSPKYQVIRFQKIAPISPANRIVGVIALADTMPCPTVAATLSEMNAPAKLSSAANVTASRGDIARVDTDVATTFAVSWKPLVKSNASAETMTITKTAPLCTSRSPGGQEFLRTIPSSV